MPAMDVTAVVGGCSTGVAVMLLVLLLVLIVLCRNRCRCCTRRQRQTKDIVEEQPATRESVHEYMELFSGDHYDHVYLPQPCPEVGTDGYLTASPSTGCGQYTMRSDNQYQENETDNTKVSTLERKARLRLQ
ncbi:uncharacterized protein LOC124282906 isoform X3 [Haliotis rubra]|uniref:uncharacterized protein LOC124282906 isoform X3 n=1 Tax=Haliotis rubra TaxID=36100 RepID=UPI001EE53F5A|nr:uncharacterized protein LOC124282906 isoform X3 [Haliotis rubra]